MARIDHWIVSGVVNPWGSYSLSAFLYYCYLLNLARSPLLFYIFTYLLKVHCNRNILQNFSVHNNSGV